MNNYETYEAAQKDFSAFAGYYIVLRYGYETWGEQFGSKRYCHTGYSIYKDAHHIQYELFQIGKRGGLKRLHLVAKNLPENTPFVTMKPDKATCCYYSDGQYHIKEEILDALVESIPETEWSNGPKSVNSYHW